ncbi:hypothetical protein ES708_34638 [subsurface metagenome]
MFQGLDIEVLVEIENRLKAELKDKELPYQRKEGIESCLYYINEAKRVKKGFYSIDKGGSKKCQRKQNII